MVGSRVPRGRWRHTLLLTTVLSAALAAQTIQIQREGPPLKSSIELTVVTATVVDADGRLVPDLTQNAFQIFEDGVQQTITQFTHERVPLGLGLLLDVSDSMFGQRILDARAAVERFLLELLAPTDAYFVMAFNHEPTLLTPWTSEPGAVRQALASLHPSGSTAIYDAVARALPLVDHRTRERAALVVISDGADTASDITLRQLRTALQRSDAFVYAIAIDSPARYALNASVDADGARRGHQPDRRPHTGRPRHQRARGRDGAHCRGAQHAVHAGVFLAASGRWPVPQHSREDNQRRLPRSRAQRLSGGSPDQHEGSLTRDARHLQSAW